MNIIFPFIGLGGKLVDRGDNTYGGKWVINPSGGLISKGHPLGATGNVIHRFHKFFVIIFGISMIYLIIDLNERLYSLYLIASALNDCLAVIFYFPLSLLYFSNLD